MCGIFVRSFVLVLPLVFQKVHTPESKESCKGSVTFVTQMYIDYLAQVRLVFYQPRSAYETTWSIEAEGEKTQVPVDKTHSQSAVLALPRGDS